MWRSPTRSRRTTSSGIVVAGIVRVAKVKLTDLGAVNNESGGIVVDTLGQASAIAITNSVASGNTSSGIEVLGDVVTGVAMKDVAGSGNGFGIFVDGSTGNDLIRFAVVSDMTAATTPAAARFALPTEGEQEGGPSS